MGTAGGSGADPGRGTHSRSELTTPHLSHLAQALNVQQLLEKKIWHFLADFGPQDRPELADRPGEAPGVPRAVAAVARDSACADCAVGSG